MTNPSNTHIPPAVNFHLWKPCNLGCKFCFAEFDDDDALKRIRTGLGESDCLAIVDALAAAGVEKLNLVGGEPTLCPHLISVIERARARGMTTSIVTNGFRLANVLEHAPGLLDWVGLSVDSASEVTQAALGRDKGDHVHKSVELVKRLHSLGIRVKLNTVVTALNWQEDMTSFVLDVRPERWKVFQVLPIAGQNDGRVEPLLVTSEQFAAFVDRHKGVAEHGIALVAETNAAMTDSYAMIDPLGRFFCNTGGRLHYSQPILGIGAIAAFEQVNFDPARFEDRGGLYHWDRRPVQLTISSR